jgi:hypothetical protein
LRLILQSVLLLADFRSEESGAGGQRPLKVDSPVGREPTISTCGPALNLDGDYPPVTTMGSSIPALTLLLTFILLLLSCKLGELSAGNNDGFIYASFDVGANFHEKPPFTIRYFRRGVCCGGRWLKV